LANATYLPQELQAHAALPIFKISDDEQRHARDGASGPRLEDGTEIVGVLGRAIA